MYIHVHVILVEFCPLYRDHSLHTYSRAYTSIKYSIKQISEIADFLQGECAKNRNKERLKAEWAAPHDLPLSLIQGPI